MLGEKTEWCIDYMLLPIEELSIGPEAVYGVCAHSSFAKNII